MVNALPISKDWILRAHDVGSNGARGEPCARADLCDGHRRIRPLGGKGRLRRFGSGLEHGDMGDMSRSFLGRRRKSISIELRETGGLLKPVCRFQCVFLLPSKCVFVLVCVCVSFCVQVCIFRHRITCGEGAGH